MTVPSLSTLFSRPTQALPAWSRLREFFAYHGVWAVGIRTLRSLSMRAKLTLMMAVVLAIVAPLTWHLVDRSTAAVGDARLRLALVRFSAVLLDYSNAVGDHRHDLEVGSPATPDRLPALLERLRLSFDDAEAAGLGLREAWERTHRRLARAASTEPASPGERLAWAEQSLQAITELRLEMLASAEEATIGDQHLHGTARLALEDAPDVNVALEAMRHALQSAPGVDEHTLPPLARHELLVRRSGLAATVEHTAAALSRRLNELKSKSAGASGASLLPAIDAYLALVKAQALVPDAGTPERTLLAAAFAQARAEVQGLRRGMLVEVEQAAAQHLDAARQERNWVLAALVLATGLSIYVNFSFYFVMRGGLSQVNQHIDRMAQGDLTARLMPQGADEVAHTLRAMTTALTRVSDLLASVRNGVGAVGQASQQVAAGNADLTRRSRANVQGVQAVVEGVAHSAGQLEACGRQIDEIVHTVKALQLDSVRNRRQMQRLSERMTALRGKSREIGEIVTLIDTIAFRTNILALNASVEASKAGEAGRGFAVVAQEVRSLALRGAESARRIGDIVVRSTEDIELSGVLADETAKALAAADGQVEQIQVSVDEVAALTRSSGADAGNVLAQLTAIQGDTAQNLQLVETLANASDSLRAQGERLAHKLAQFRLS
jgi:methyl-accepting chemotaxis protein I, serine sensor receptor